MRYDFHRLKPVTCYDAITLRIPERWDVSEDNGDMWGYYEADDEHGVDPDTGTLWIALNRFHPRRFGGLVPRRDLRKSIEGLAQKLRSQNSVVDEKPIETVDGGYLWYYAFDAVEKGEPLRYFRYDFHLSHGDDLCVISFSLVFTQAQLNEPDFELLRRTMDREIRAARFDPFADAQRQEAEKTLGALHLCNFGDQVKLVVPEAISWRRFEEDGDIIYTGLLDAASSFATITVMVDAWSEDDGGDAEGDLQADAVEDHIAIWKEAPGFDGEITRSPNGALLYEVLGAGEEESAPAAAPDSSGGVEILSVCHQWICLRCDGADARELVVQFTLSQPAQEQALFSNFIAFLGGEIPRAEFPGLEKE